MKQPRYETVSLEKIVGGGQALGTLKDGRKCFMWGGLPGETVVFRVTKKKAHFVEGVVTEVLTAALERTKLRDPDSYLSTSPWQIMNFDAEQHYKAALIEEAFELHDIVLPNPIDIFTDRREFHYRNKVEFSWYGDKVALNLAPQLHSQDNLEHSEDALTSDEAITTRETLDLAFFRRGSKGKIVVDGTSLANDNINQLARAIRDLLRAKPVSARSLKTLLIRCNQQGKCVWQLYLKDEISDLITPTEAANLPAQGGEIIYSDPRSPASRITKRLAKFGDTTLTDIILGTPFRYACEGFFQVNVPVYEQALRDMRKWVEYFSVFSSTSAQTRETRSSNSRRTEDCLSEASSAGARELDDRDSRRAEAVEENTEKSEYTTLDLYSGVGTIGLTIGGDNVTLVEINEHAVAEMRRNIAALGRTSARAILAPSEKALDYITDSEIVTVDPPRAGLHVDVIATLLQKAPPRIIYLSCNPVTQARDVALLAEKYGIRAHRGYNFFPRTPHIEHLVILDRIA